MSKPKRRGNLSNEEKVFITNSVRTMTVEDIAKQLNRRVQPVSNYINSTLKHVNTKTVDKFDLESREYWPDIKKQFNKDEIGLFKFHWTEIIRQFNKDVIHTEELQIIDVVKHEILCSRALKKQQETEEMIIRIQAQAHEIRMRPDLSEDEFARLDNLDRQINVLQASGQDISKDFKLYQDNKNKLFDKIKGSRDQRVSKIEDRRDTFASLVIKLRKDPAFAEECSLDMEKMRISMGQQLRELGDYLEYADSQLDRPILNSQTVFFEEEDEDSN